MINGSLALLSDAFNTYRYCRLGDLTDCTSDSQAAGGSEKNLRLCAPGNSGFDVQRRALLFLVAMYILYEAYQRFFMPAEIATGAMMWIATPA